MTQTSEKDEIAKQTSVLKILAMSINQDRSGWCDKAWKDQGVLHKEDLLGHAAACIAGLACAGFEIVKIDRKD